MFVGGIRVAWAAGLATQRLVIKHQNWVGAWTMSDPQELSLGQGSSASPVRSRSLFRPKYALAAALILVLVIVGVRTLLFQPFSVPAASMLPTLHVGDQFFAVKYAYGYSRYSLPGSPPLFSGRIFAAAPERGDVVVFRLPKDPSVDYVKRVVGLPGDRIQMKNGQLYINDNPVARQRLPDLVGQDACGSGPGAVTRWRETLPNGVSYETLDCVDNGFYDNTNVYSVPAGHFFMMGDNRDNSTDSRVQSAVGYVPLDNMVGRLGMIFVHGNGG
jgi:signal peptidase I